MSGRQLRLPTTPPGSQPGGLAERDVTHPTVTLGDFHLPMVPAVPVILVQFAYDSKGVRLSSRIIRQFGSAVVLKPATVVRS
jgi:hypothetical protein